MKTVAGACVEPFLSVSRGHGVFSCFVGISVSWSVDVGCQGLDEVCSKVTFIVDGVV